MEIKKIRFSKIKFPSKKIYSKHCQIKGGLCSKIVRQISEQKKEPAWMLQYRLKALEYFKAKPMPSWGPDLSRIEVNKIMYYLKPFKKQEKSWQSVPQDIRNTFKNLGLQKAEKKHLAGLGAQYESEVVYHNLKKEWKEKGIIFCDTDSALQKYPEIFKKYFGRI